MFANQPVTEHAYGEVVSTPKHHEGYCAVEEVGPMVKAFRVVDEDGHALTPGALPFIGNCRYEGERWQLRVEPPAFHSVNGATMWGCRWVFALGSGGSDQNR